MSGRRVVVVGGGVVGAACAYYLAEDGWLVTIVERDRFGAGCSHANCGFVCPSHVLPLAGPGAIGEALRSLGRRGSPLSIRPRLDRALWAWLWAFARRCNRRDMLAAGRAIQPLLVESMKEYRRLVEAGLLDCQWQERGLLFVYASPNEFEAYAETDRLLRDEFDESAERIDGDALLQFEPALAEGLAGGWHYREDAHLRPDLLMASWRATLERRGVEVREQREMRGLRTAENGDAVIETSDGDLAADAFVVTAGALTARWAGSLGCRIPIQPGKGYSLTMPRPPFCPTIPLIFPETRVAVTPLQDAFRLGSTMEFAGFDDSLPARRLQLLRDGAAPYLRQLPDTADAEPWFGWRPMTPDGLPIIDRSPAAGNVWIAAGHNMLGVSMAPATGRLVAELLDGRPPSIDPRPYSVLRF